MTDRIIIIGAGIVGICTALSLAEKGFAVEVIDRNEPASGASHGNAGVVSPWSCIPQSMPGRWRQVPRWLLDRQGPLTVRPNYLLRFLPWALKFLKSGTMARLPGIADAMNALNRPNLSLYRQHLDGTGEESLLADSFYLYVYRDATNINLNHLAWRMRAERDVPLHVVNGGELREIEPALSPTYEGAVVLKGQARARDPGGIGRALAAKAKTLGARFRTATVREIRPTEAGGWQIQIDNAVLEAPQIVLAAGAWSATLLRPLGLHLPLEAERGYHLIFRDPGITVTHSIMETERYFVASSMLAGLRCAGTAEFAGLEAAPDYRRAQLFAGLAKELFPAMNTEDTVEWMGARPSFPDSLPCIGEAPKLRNLFCAFGHSHYGFGMAPQTGRLVAALVSRTPPNIDLSPYRVDRF